MTTTIEIDEISKCGPTDVTSLIQELRGQGLSLAAIAGELTRRGIKTKQGCDSWDKKQVCRILERAGDAADEGAAAPDKGAVAVPVAEEEKGPLAEPASAAPFFVNGVGVPVDWGARGVPSIQFDSAHNVLRVDFCCRTRPISQDALMELRSELFVRPMLEKAKAALLGSKPALRHLEFVRADLVREARTESARSALEKLRAEAAWIKAEAIIGSTLSPTEAARRLVQLEADIAAAQRAADEAAKQAEAEKRQLAPLADAARKKWDAERDTAATKAAKETLPPLLERVQQRIAALKSRDILSGAIYADLEELAILLSLAELLQADERRLQRGGWPTAGISPQEVSARPDSPA